MMANDSKLNVHESRVICQLAEKRADTRVAAAVLFNNTILLQRHVLVVHICLARCTRLNQLCLLICNKQADVQPDHLSNDTYVRATHLRHIRRRRRRKSDAFLRCNNVKLNAYGENK